MAKKDKKAKKILLQYPNGDEEYYQRTLKKKKKHITQSEILGFMFRHTDGDTECWYIPLSRKDMDAIYEILEKYEKFEEDGESIRGRLKIVDMDDEDNELVL